MALDLIIALITSQLFPLRIFGNTYAAGGRQGHRLSHASGPADWIVLSAPSGRLRSLCANCLRMHLSIVI